MQDSREALGAGRGAKRLVACGVEIAYCERGEGPPLVCLHSIAHGARDFAGLQAAFASQRRVIALDWPAHGSSGGDVRPASAHRYAEILAGALDALRIERCVLLGNSIGGAAALEVAAAQPERVAGLVLVDSGGLVPVHAVTRLLTRTMAAFFAAGARGARWYPRAFSAYYGLVLPGAAAREQRERIIAACVESAQTLAEAWRSFGAPEADQRAVAARLRCPVLVAWARSDRVIPLSFARAAIRLIPDVELETFPGGHAPFLECPERFEPVLARFLARWDAAPEGAANAR